jgi:hypothetical protein
MTHVSAPQAETGLACGGVPPAISHTCPYMLLGHPTNHASITSSPRTFPL